MRAQIIIDGRAKRVGGGGYVSAVGLSPFDLLADFSSPADFFSETKVWAGAGSVSACVGKRMEFQSRGGISLLVYITMGYRVERRSLDKFLHGRGQRLIALEPEFCL